MVSLFTLPLQVLHVLPPRGLQTENKYSSDIGERVARAEMRRSGPVRVALLSPQTENATLNQ